MKTGRPELDARLRVSAMPADEPVFILRGQDLCADAAVRHYAQTVLARGGPVALAESALQQADDMQNWPTRRMPDIELREADRLQLEYHHGRRPEVRDGALEASHVYERGVAAGVARERRGSQLDRARREALGALDLAEGEQLRQAAAAEAFTPLPLDAAWPARAAYCAWLWDHGSSLLDFAQRALADGVEEAAA